MRCRCDVVRVERRRVTQTQRFQLAVACVSVSVLALMCFAVDGQVARCFVVIALVGQSANVGAMTQRWLPGIWQRGARRPESEWSAKK